MAPTINIERRYCGPSDSGNGGYTAGLLAATLGGQVEVTLSRPLPLDRPLRVAEQSGTMLLLDGDETLATAAPSDTPLPAPPAFVSVADARAAAEECAVVLHPDWHPAPQCFVCGNERVAGDGLRIFPGPVAPGHYAAPWRPSTDLAADGAVRPEFVWSALDCPSSFLIYDPPGTRPEGFYVLGRMTARLDADVRASEEYVVQSWLLAHEGRKLQAASAVCGADGAALAIARATWIRI
jgi:hypothetical protein